MKSIGIRKNAFTLIELLVVVAIIAVLIALLLPALGKARQTTKRLVCASQLKTMGQGLALYANDHNGWGPYNKVIQDYTQWRTPLNPYKYIQFGLLFKYVGGESEEVIPKIFMCPEDVWDRKTYSQFGRYTSYIYNYFAGSGIPGTSMKLHDLPPDRATVIDYCVWGYAGLQIQSNTNHKGLGINVLRADGRVEWVDIHAIPDVPGTFAVLEVLDNVH